MKQFNFTLNGHQGVGEAKDKNHLVMNLIDQGDYDPASDLLIVENESAEIKPFPTNAYMQTDGLAIKTHLNNLLTKWSWDDIEATIKVMKGVL